MTVLMKPSLTLKKTPLLDEKSCDEAVIEVETSDSLPRQYSTTALLCMSITLFLLVLMGIITTLQIIEQTSNDVTIRNRYKGFCSIPVSKAQDMLEERRIPLSWKSTESSGHAVPDIQVVNLLNQDPEHLLDLLREQLDIDLNDAVEKITVLNNGHPVSFVHDFDANITGIIDDERCFMMELDPELVLQPEVFALRLESGDAFDVSLVRTQLRAVLPAARAAAADQPRALRAPCAHKPVYRLQRENAIVIRKRSADAPPHDFIQFAGKRIQQIQISNLVDVVDYEKKKPTN